MEKYKKLPKIISVFPLSNFVIFPNTSVPLNIFEPRYIEMIDNSMKTDRIIGIIQLKNKRTASHNYIMLVVLEKLQTLMKLKTENI